MSGPIAIQGAYGILLTGEQVRVDDEIYLGSSFQLNCRPIGVVYDKFLRQMLMVPNSAVVFHLDCDTQLEFLGKCTKACTMRQMHGQCILVVN